MKVIDLSPLQNNLNPIQKLIAQIQGVSRFGYDWIGDLKVQADIIELTKNLLDSHYTMLRYVTLESLEIPIPLILIGPAGICVVYTSGVKGIFQAKNESWAEMNRSTQKYEPKRNNLINRTQLMMRAVDAFLTRRKQPHPPLQAAIIFPNPGTHVDAVRPAVRIVLSDGIERFVGSLVQSKPVLNPNEAASIIETLTQGRMPVEKPAEPKAERHDVFDLRELPAEKPKPRPAGGKASPVGKLKINRNQWVFLGVMAALEVIVIIIAIVFFIFILPSL